MSSKAKFSAAVAFLNASHAAFLAHGLARTSKATRKLFSDTVAHAATMTGEEGGLSLEENTCDVIRMACVMGDHTKVAHRVSYVEPEAPAPVEPEAETFTLLDRPGLAFRTVRRYMAAEVIPSVEGLSICGGFTTCARVEDVRFLTGPDAAPVEPVAPVQSAPEALDDTHASADAASVELVAAGFTASPVWGAMWVHADGRRATVERNSKGRFHVRHIPAPAPVATWSRPVVSDTDHAAAVRAHIEYHAGPDALTAPVAMVRQPVQQQQAKARAPKPARGERRYVTVRDTETGEIHRVLTSVARVGVAVVIFSPSNRHREGGLGGMLITHDDIRKAWVFNDEAEARHMLSNNRALGERVIRAELIADPAPAVEMVVLPVQQAQSRDMRAAPAPVEPIDGLGAMLARIEATTGPRVVLAAPRAAPEAAPDVVEFDGPGSALGIAACCGLISAAAAYLIAAGLLA